MLVECLVQTSVVTDFKSVYCFLLLLGSSWQVGCAMASALAVGGAIAKYTGAYKHPFRTDRVFL